MMEDFSVETKKNITTLDKRIDTIEGRLIQVAQDRKANENGSSNNNNNNNNNTAHPNSVDSQSNSNHTANNNTINNPFPTISYPPFPPTANTTNMKNTNGTPLFLNQIISNSPSSPQNNNNNSNSHGWEKSNSQVVIGNIEAAYNVLLMEGDILQLIRLMEKTGIYLSILSIYLC